MCGEDGTEQNEAIDWSNRLETRSRSSEIYSIIREGIIAGQWLPGDRIDDKELALKLGVSRLSVREALSKFYESRIVERIHWKGFFLRKISVKEIESIVEIRIALEKVAIRNAIAKADAAFYDELEQAIFYAEQALESDDHAEYMKRDFRFHALIYEASENTWIAMIIDNFIVLIDVLRNLSMMPDFASAARVSMADHRLILSHMRNKDVDAAIAELCRHMQTFYNNTVSGYRSAPHPAELT